MAEGFARQNGGRTIKAASAGTKPVSEIDPVAVKVMLERDIDISSQSPKQLMDDDIDKYDLVITMGCGVEVMCPFIPSKKKRDWELENPKGKPMDIYRKVCDEIENKVRSLS